MSMRSEVQAERRRLLCSVFETLKERYQKRQHGRKKVAWSGGQSGALDNIDRQWGYYVQNLPGVQSWLNEGAGGAIEWYKIVAMTQYNILETMPVTFDEKNFPKGKDYGLNVEYAFLFGWGTMESWHRRWYELQLLEFDTNSFARSFNSTKEGLTFKQKHHDLLVYMLNNKPSFPSLLMASQLWFDAGRWGLAMMKLDKSGW